MVSWREKSTAGFKKLEDRLTFLGYNNATGTHNLKPVTIGKFAKPRCFKKRVIGQSSFEDESSGDEEDEGQDQKVVSNSIAVECFEKCLLWMERQNNVQAIQIVQLRRMMELSIGARDILSYDKTDLLQKFRPM